MITQLVSIAKLCVGIFAVLSGYGMYMSYRKHLQRANNFLANARYMLTHFLHIYEVFWLTAIPTIAFVAVTRRSLPEIFGHATSVNLLLNLAGVSWLLGKPMFVNSWWYISAVLIYYSLFPFVFYLVAGLGKGNYAFMALLAVAEVVLSGLGSIPVYGIFFVCGMILAERDVLNRFLAWGKRSQNTQLTCALLAAIVVALIALRQGCLYGTRHEYHFDYLIVVPLCLLVGLLVRGEQAEALGLLEFTGILSFPMYVFHGCLIRYYGSVVTMLIAPWKVFLWVYMLSLGAAQLVKALQEGERRLLKEFMEH